MIHCLEKLEIAYPTHSNDKFLPENIKKNKWYSVVAEKTGIRQSKDKTRGKIEDLFLGFINEDYKLVFGASFNMMIRIKGEENKEKNEHF